MNTYFKNDLKQAWMVIEGETELKVDFQTFMLQENVIPGLLKTDIRYVDSKSCYHYDISGKVSLQSKHEKMKLKSEDITRLIHDILKTMKEIKKYMLDGAGVLLDPEYIYCKDDRYYFCYYPPCEDLVTDKFHRLTEFFVREVDYRDKEGVHMAYTLHRASMEDNYSVEKIMEEVAADEEPVIVRYEKRMEDAEGEQALSGEIAEERNLWEPVRRFLERRKREKRGWW